MFAQRGQAGELRAGPYVAARFGAWSLVRPDDVLGSDVAAVTVDTLVIVDTFRFGHAPLDLWLDCAQAWWVWRGVIRGFGQTWQTPGGRPEIRVK